MNEYFVISIVIAGVDGGRGQVIVLNSKENYNSTGWQCVEFRSLRYLLCQLKVQGLLIFLLLFMSGFKGSIWLNSTIGATFPSWLRFS